MYFEGAIRKTAKEKKQATLLVPTIAGPRHARTEHHTTPHHTTATAPAPVLLLRTRLGCFLPSAFSKIKPQPERRNPFHHSP
jgi:hypothetical protein